MQVTNADKKPEVVKSWTKRSRCFQFDETQFLSSSGVSRWLCTAFPAWSKTPWNSCYIGRWPCYPWSSRIWSAANLVGRHCQSTHISGNEDPSSKDHHDECIWEGKNPPPTDTTTTGNLLEQVPPATTTACDGYTFLQKLITCTQQMNQEMVCVIIANKNEQQQQCNKLH